MSVLPNQTNISKDKYFFLTVNASSINVDTITAKTITTSNIDALLGNFSSLTASNLSSISTSTQYLYGNVIDVDDLDAVNISTHIISADTFYGTEVSTVFNYTDIGTISTLFTQHIILDQATLDVVNGTTLLLNGVPIATTQDLSTIQDWSIYPAYSTIQVAGNDVDLGTQSTPFRFGYFSTISTGNINVSTLNGGAIVSGSNWSLFPAVSNPNINGYNVNNVGTLYANDIRTQFGKANVNFAVSNVSVPNQGIMMDAVGNIVVQNSTDYYTLINGSLYTSQYGSANNKTQIDGKQVIVDGGAINRTTITAGDIVTRTVRVGDIASEQAEVAIYGRYLTAFDNALYVSGGFTTEGGFTHGVSLGCAGFGTYPASAMANRIDLLPIGTQLFQTFGATAIIAGLGITIDTGLGMNLAAGLVLDFLARDIKIRANRTITLDADNEINMRTKNITMTTDNLTQNVTNFVFNDSNFTVNSSNQNSLNATKIFQGTPLPPSTIGFYSTTLLNSKISNFANGAFITSQKQFGLYENISTLSWVVDSNISTIFSTSISSLLSSYTSTITSSLVRSYSTLSILQNFPIGEVNLTVSSLLLQHADKIELDTKPFPIFTTLTPGLSTLVSSLYTYEALLDGSKYSEIGQIIQTIVPQTQFFSTFNISTSISSGNVFSSVVSSFFSTLFSQTTFTSSIYNQILYDSNAFSTPSILTSTLNGQKLPYPYGSFTINTSQIIGVPNTAVSTIFDTTEYANGISIVGVSGPQIAVSSSGLYRWLASPQFDTTSGGVNEVAFWFQKNGSNIPRSASRATVANNAELFSAVEIFEKMNSQDTLSFCFTSADTNMKLSYLGASGVIPENPALILVGQKIADL